MTAVPGSSAPLRARWVPLLASTVVLATIAAGNYGRDGANPPAFDDRAVVELTVDARVRAGRLRPIWDEVNLWKLHALFGVDRADPAASWGSGWMRARVPWVRYGRVVAALGGNYAAAVAPWCDWGTASPEHPQPNAGECGRDGRQGPAAANELVHEQDGRAVVDYRPWRMSIERLLASGVVPHVNLSAAPAAFTGGVTDFTAYHWNAAPVRDLDGWQTFVRGAFAAVADLGTTGWRASIVNEPNCLTLVGWRQEVRHVGFAGTAEDYARMFAAGAAAIKAAAPGVQIHAGNYVTSATFAGEYNLPEYLVALRQRLIADGGVQWTDLSAASVSLYETSDTTLYEFVPGRLRRLQTAIDAAGLPSRPVKVDELEVLPALAAEFTATEHQRFDTTLYAASWHAEVLRQLIDADTVMSVAPWLDRLFDLWSGGRTWTPYPKAFTYELLGLLAGQLDAHEGPDGISVAPTQRTTGLPRLGVTGERLGHPLASRVHRARASSLTALAARLPHGVRILVVHHWNVPVPDRSPRRRMRARDVRILVRGLAPGGYSVRHLTIGGPGGARWSGATTTPLHWQDDGCRTTSRGGIELVPTRRMDADTVWLFDATRAPHCAGSDRHAGSPPDRVVTSGEARKG